MVTIYEVKIKTVSPWVSYNEEYIKNLFVKFLKDYHDKDSYLGFENTEIEVKRK